MDLEGLDSCSICMDEYGDNVRPRSLPCGHTFCGSCLTYSVENGTLSCPQCKKPHRASSANEFPVIYGMEALISKLRSLQYSTIPEQKKNDSGSAQSRHKWQEFFYYQKESLEDFIKITDEMESETLQMKDTAYQRKKQYEFFHGVHCHFVKKYAAVIDDFESKANKLSDILKEKEKLKERVNATLCRSAEDACASDIGEAVTCHELLEEWIAKRSQVHQTFGEAIKRSDELIRDTIAVFTEERLEDDETSGETVDPSILRPSVMDRMIKRMIRNQILPIDKLESKSAVVKLLVERGHMYATQNEEGKIRSAKITLEKDRLYLHHLKDEEPPPLAYTVQHSELIGSLDNSSLTTFLDLSWEGSVRGRLHILLSPDTPLARHFRLLCCGDEGSSYCHSRFHKVWQKDNDIYESVYGGDYECGDGSGGAPLMIGLNPRDEIYERKCEAGIVYVVHSNINNPKISQFGMLTGKGYNSTCSGVFGHVQEGLDSVREAAKLDDIRKLIIADCGVILNI